VTIGRRCVPVAIAVLLGAESGCAQRNAWQQDESRRIDEVVRAEKFSENLPEAEGTPLLAPPSTAPPLPTGTYAIQNTPPKSRAKTRRGTAADTVDITSSTNGLQRQSHSKARQKREQELISNPTAQGSSSR
jgi:hypothetical protein